jgi:hypothetical protein
MTSRLRSDVGELLRPIDPASGATLSTTVDRADTLRRILAHPTPAPAPRRPARRLMIVVASLAALVLAAVVGYSFIRLPEPAYAATPALLTPAGGGGSAAQRLTVIAARAAAAPAPRRRGDDEHLVIRSWSLWTQIDGGRVRSAVIPDRTEIWRRPDNSGLIQKRYEAPQFPPGSDRLSWWLHGAPGRSADPTTDSYPAGRFPAMWSGPPPATGIDAWLSVGHPRENGPAETLIAVTDLARERVLTPPIRAAVLRAVAALPGLTYDGTVTDRAGRPGQAYSIESDYTGLPTRYTLIVDATTGVLLGFEQTLTTTAGKLDVKVPCVIGYDTFAVAEFGTAPH